MMEISKIKFPHTCCYPYWILVHYYDSQKLLWIRRVIVSVLLRPDEKTLYENASTYNVIGFGPQNTNLAAAVAVILYPATKGDKSLTVCKLRTVSYVYTRNSDFQPRLSVSILLGVHFGTFFYSYTCFFFFFT